MAALRFDTVLQELEHSIADLTEEREFVVRMMQHGKSPDTPETREFSNNLLLISSRLQMMASILAER